MILLILQRRGLDLFKLNRLLHFLSELIETFKVEYTLGDRVENIFSFKDVGCSGLLSDSFEVDFAIEDQRTIAIDVEGGLALLWLNHSSQLDHLLVVMVPFVVDIDFAAIDDD